MDAFTLQAVADAAAGQATWPEARLAEPAPG